MATEQQKSTNETETKANEIGPPKPVPSLEVMPSTASSSEALASQSKNSLAIVAFVLSLLGFIIFVLGIIGMILGIIALKRSKVNEQRGRKLAIAAIIIGFISGFLAIILIAIFAGTSTLQKDAQKHTSGLLTSSAIYRYA